MNIFNICFNDEDIEEEKLQQIIDALHAIGSDFWEDVEDYMCFADGWSWLEYSNGKLDINGNRIRPEPGMEVVDFDTWFELALKTIEEK